MPQQQRYCLCGCGTPVTNKWVRGHSARGQGGGAGLAAVPPPGDPAWDSDDVLDVGELIPDAADSTGTPPVGDASPADGGDGSSAGSVPPADDEPPAHARREWRRGPRPSKGKPARITNAIRTDITAKIAFALQVPGMVWQARDPLCGGTFVQQIPETAEAFADIVCDSPDLVAFMTGPGGNFMKVLKVGAALYPVATVLMAHHVYHTIELGQPEQADAGVRYAA